MKKVFFFALVFLVCALSAFAQDVKAAAITARSKQPAVMLDHAQASAVLRDTVILLGKDWAFLRKDGGNNCDVGAAFKVSCDWVIHIPSNQGCDLFGDAPGFGSDGKPVRGTMQPAGCHLRPSSGQYVPVTSTPIPQPPSNPQPPSDLENRVRGLQDNVDDLRAIVRDLQSQLNTHRKDIDAINSKPTEVELPLEVLLDGLKKVYFECAIGRSAFHGHACTIAEPRAK
jgi:peptidoglycan hydrolase CwlO-like protein